MVLKRKLDSFLNRLVCPGVVTWKKVFPTKLDHTMRLISIITIVLVAGMSFTACKEDSENDSSPVVFSTTMNGASEVPPNASSATGDAVLTFNNNNKTFSIVVTYTGLTPSMGHIHKGAVGVSGDVVFPFTSLTSPLTFTSPTLTAEQEADLRAGLYYVNLHTTAFPAGEIRGQLTTRQNQQ